ncbi:uncharacterized protein LOC116189620 isoform X3 [Punica granatum]|uniref:Uncharacterized protein LOC116189620 isoform X3 n=1 Tax=Punica granatum TaxID=22663 RepID=A0A6P8BW93_PUNGR|nr:uncharacterized protein LOC116189620 isoform X3 [Punica granatum]
MVMHYIACSFGTVIRQARDMRGRIGDKWSMRVLWASAIGSGIGLYMVIVERQLQNRERMAAEALQSLDSNSGSREED